MIRNTNNSERLYLSKKPDETIYIENCKIPQQHIDGVRFLYKQYKRKKPGIIINDAAGSSRYLPLVLFLKAIIHLLKQPVLILCQEGAEHGWMEQFNTWTDLCDDVVLETQKPHNKKQVLINTMANLSSFCTRNWSLLVIDVPDFDKPVQQLFRFPFKADFKMWITPIDMKKNLDHFTKIYKWLYPKENFDKNLFTPNRNNLSDVVDKAILLDAFMEDIVARNLDLPSSAENNQKYESPIRKISLKNKDATGTKIKRSKRKIHDDDDNEPHSAATNKQKLEAALSKDLSDDFSIDNFKRKSKRSHELPLSDKKESNIILKINKYTERLISDDKESETGIEMDTLNSQSQVNLFYEPDSSTVVNSDRLYEMDTLVIGNDICDEQGVNVNESMNVIIEYTENNDLEHNETKLESKDITLRDVDLNNQQSNDICDEQGVNANESTTVIIEYTENNDLKHNETKLESKDITLRDVDLNKLQGNDICDEQGVNANESTNVIIEYTENNDLEHNETNLESKDISLSDVGLTNQQESKLIDINTESSSILDMISENDDVQENCVNVKMVSPSTNNELKPNINELINKRPSVCDGVTTDINSDKKNNISGNEVHIKSNNNEINDNENKIDTTVKNALKRNCIEDKMKEFEEKAMKKFKGSIFDSLF